MDLTVSGHQDDFAQQYQTQYSATTLPSQPITRPITQNFKTMSNNFSTSNMPIAGNAKPNDGDMSHTLRPGLPHSAQNQQQTGQPFPSGTQETSQFPYQDSSRSGPSGEEYPEILAWSPFHGQAGQNFTIQISDITYSPRSYYIMFGSLKCAPTIASSIMVGSEKQVLILVITIPPYSEAANSYASWNNPRSQVGVWLMTEDQATGAEISIIPVCEFLYWRQDENAPVTNDKSKMYAGYPFASSQQNYNQFRLPPQPAGQSVIPRDTSNIEAPDISFEYSKRNDKSVMPGGALPRPPLNDNIGTPQFRSNYVYGSGVEQAPLPVPSNDEQLLGVQHQNSSYNSMTNRQEVMAVDNGNALGLSNLYSPVTRDQLNMAENRLDGKFEAEEVQQDPPLVRISQSSNSRRVGQFPSMQSFNRVQAVRAKLEILGDLQEICHNWTELEWRSRRRLVQFWRQQQDHVIKCTFRSVLPHERLPNSIVISCIFWDNKRDCYVTSVDCIYLLESLIGMRFSVDEKNRIRRNLEGFRPLTVSKTKADSSDFFRLIMSFPNPKPRNIEKDVKVFPWAILGLALKKIIGKYFVNSDLHSPQAAALPPYDEERRANQENENEKPHSATSIASAQQASGKESFSGVQDNPMQISQSMSQRFSINEQQA